MSSRAHKLEHITVTTTDKVKLELQVQLSIALSLKRVADALESIDLTGPNHNLLNLAYEVGKSFSHGTEDKRR